MELSEHYGINPACKVWFASPEGYDFIKVSQLADNFHHHFSRVFGTLLTNPEDSGMRNTD